MLAIVEIEGHSPSSWRKVGFIAGFWLGLGFLVGTAEHLTSGSGNGAPTWLQTTTPFLLAGILWIPLSLSILWASRRVPPFFLDDGFGLNPAGIAVHGVASLTLGIVFNLVFFGILRIPGSSTQGSLWDMAMTAALRWAHINAGVYWVIAISAHVPVILARRAASHVGDRDADTGEDTLTVRSGTQSILVRVADIRWIEGAGDYVRLHLGMANHLYSERLKHLESRLDPGRFVRVHRSAIVNVSAVRKLRHLGHGDYEATLDDGATVRVSRTRRSRLTEALHRGEVNGLGAHRDA